jgi:hypothetical protein
MTNSIPFLPRLSEHMKVQGLAEVTRTPEETATSFKPIIKDSPSQN